MWDPVPWLVGGGAEHSPEVARLLAYASTSGAEGIVSPADLKVSALTVPGASVRVAEGSALVRSRAAGGDQQTYVGRNVGQDVVGIAATGSGGGRSDLVVLRVEDPFAPGEPWDEPADAKVGPYIYTRVIPGVSPTATAMPAGMTGLPLARIDIPANTATITNDMITDLRSLAMPREHRRAHVVSVITSVQTPPNSAVYEEWALPETWVDVPEWATEATIVTTLTGVIVGPVNIDRHISTNLGYALFGNGVTVDFDNASPARSTREIIVCSADGRIESVAGTRQKIRVLAQGSGVMTFNTQSQAVHDITFYERRV